MFLAISDVLHYNIRKLPFSLVLVLANNSSTDPSVNPNRSHLEQKDKIIKIVHTHSIVKMCMK